MAPAAGGGVFVGRVVTVGGAVLVMGGTAVAMTVCGTTTVCKIGDAGGCAWLLQATLDKATTSQRNLFKCIKPSPFMAKITRIVDSMEVITKETARASYVISSG